MTTLAVHLQHRQGWWDRMMVKDRLGGSGRAPAARQDLERVGFEVPGSCATVELKGQQ